MGCGIGLLGGDVVGEVPQAQLTHWKSAIGEQVVASAWIVEGVGNSPAIMLISTAKPPRSIQLDQQPLDLSSYDAAEGLLYLRFPNEARPRNLVVAF